MPLNSRSKGAAAERELFHILSSELGFVVKRNLDAPREGGSDTISIPGWAVEVKRREVWSNAYWLQTIKQAMIERCKPVLFYRANRQPWKAYFDASIVVDGIQLGMYGPIETDLETAILIIREDIAGETPNG